MTVLNSKKNKASTPPIRLPTMPVYLTSEQEQTLQHPHKAVRLYLRCNTQVTDGDERATRTLPGNIEVFKLRLLNQRRGGRDMTGPFVRWGSWRPIQVMLAGSPYFDLTSENYTNLLTPGRRVIAEIERAPRQNEDGEIRWNVVRLDIV